MTAPVITHHSDQAAPAGGTMMLDIPESPRDPFGALVLPRMDVPVTDRGLKLAHAAMMAHFSVTDEAAMKAKGGVAAQLTKAYAIVLDRTRWEIQESHVIIRNEEGQVYRTTPAFCEGPPWYNPRSRTNTKACKGEMKANVSMCKHQIAIEYLRLAQELDPPILALTDADAAPAEVLADVPALTQIATVDLPGFAFFSLLGCINVKQKKVAAEQVDILISGGENFVCVSSGLYNAQAPVIPQGGAYLSMEPEAFDELWKAICAEGMKTEVLTLSVAIDEEQAGTLTVSGGSINVSIAIMGTPYNLDEPASE